MQIKNLHKKYFCLIIYSSRKTWRIFQRLFSNKDLCTPRIGDLIKIALIEGKTGEFYWGASSKRLGHIVADKKGVGLAPYLQVVSQ